MKNYMLIIKMPMPMFVYNIYTHEGETLLIIYAEAKLLFHMDFHHNGSLGIKNALMTKCRLILFCQLLYSADR